MSTNRELLKALMAASKKKDHEAFLALWVDEDLEYYWSMHAKPITSKEKLRKFLRNYEGMFDQQDWTITHCVEQGDLMFCEGVETLFDRANQKVIRNPFMQAIDSAAAGSRRCATITTAPWSSHPSASRRWGSRRVGADSP